MNDKEFEIKGIKYQSRKIDAFKQFHIVRRIAPILADLLPIANKLAKLKDSELGEDQFESLAPIMNGISKLSDEDSNKVLMGLLEAVETDRGGAWAPLAKNGSLMFQDMDLPVMLQCAGRAFMYNMGDFISVLPKVSPGRG